MSNSPAPVVVSFSVNFELNTTNGLRRVVFGLEKDAKGTDSEWQIHFTLFERAKRTESFCDPVVKLDVDVHTSLAPGAADLSAKKEPTPEQTAALVGPVAEDAKAVHAGKLSKPEFDQSAQSVLG